MSFGYSIGDFVLVTQLAYSVVKNARKACGAHSALAREVNSLHVVLVRLESEVSKPESILSVAAGSEDSDGRLEKRKELSGLVTDCERVLKILASILKKFNALPDEQRSAKKLWQKIRFGNGEMQDLAKIRSELATHTQAITLFLNLLGLGSQGKVERYMETHGAELREIKTSLNWVTAKLQVKEAYTHGERSILSSHVGDDKEVWKMFRRELIQDGISSCMLRKHKQTIKKYVVELGARGVLDDAAIEDVTETGLFGGRVSRYEAKSDVDSTEPYANGSIEGRFTDGLDLRGEDANSEMSLGTTAYLPRADGSVQESRTMPSEMAQSSDCSTTDLQCGEDSGNDGSADEDGDEDDGGDGSDGASDEEIAQLSRSAVQALNKPATTLEPVLGLSNTGYIKRIVHHRERQDRSTSRSTETSDDSDGQPTRHENDCLHFRASTLPQSNRNRQPLVAAKTFQSSILSTDNNLRHFLSSSIDLNSVDNIRDFHGLEDSDSQGEGVLRGGFSEQKLLIPTTTRTSQSRQAFIEEVEDADFISGAHPNCWTESSEEIDTLDEDDAPFAPSEAAQGKSPLAHLADFTPRPNSLLLPMSSDFEASNDRSTRGSRREEGKGRNVQYTFPVHRKLNSVHQEIIPHDYPDSQAQNSVETSDANLINEFKRGDEYHNRGIEPPHSSITPAKGLKQSHLPRSRQQLKETAGTEADWGSASEREEAETRSKSEKENQVGKYEALDRRKAHYWSTRLTAEGAFSNGQDPFPIPATPPLPPRSPAVWGSASEREYQGRMSKAKKKNHRRDEKTHTRNKTKEKIEPRETAQTRGRSSESPTWTNGSHFPPSISVSLVPRSPAVWGSASEREGQEMMSNKEEAIQQPEEAARTEIMPNFTDPPNPPFYRAFTITPLVPPRPLKCDWTRHTISESKVPQSVLKAELSLLQEKDKSPIADKIGRLSSKQKTAVYNVLVDLFGDQSFEINIDGEKETRRVQEWHVCELVKGRDRKSKRTQYLRVFFGAGIGKREH